ncbi:MAG TPA: Calx-beta domain-containing protein [Thermoleophilaceae bacterium]
MRRLVTGALALTLLAAATPASAAIRLVDDDGAATAADCNAGAGGSASTTIQTAVNAATSGADTIQVCPGTYAEKVTVNKVLVINGPKAGVDGRSSSRNVPANEAIVTGSGAGANVTTAFNVTASNVTIDGFTAQGQTSTADLGAEIVTGANTAAITIQNNIIQNAVGGIMLGSDSTTIRRNLIRNNNNVGPASGTAVYTDQFVAGGPQNGVRIEENTISGHSAGAVTLLSTLEGSQSDFTITANLFDQDGNAFVFGNLSDSSFTRNTVTNSTASGVAISKSVDNLLIAENVMQTGATRAFRFIDVGLGTQPDTDVTLRCNSISGYPVAGLTVENGVMGEPLDARFNFWGNASGPTIASNPGGTGEVIEDPSVLADYSSFLVEGTDSDQETPGFQCEPKLSVADATVSEGDSGTSSLAFTVKLNNPSPDGVTVVYATTDGTATGGDYQPVADVLKISPGETTKTVVVPVVGDTAVEPDETLTLKLLQPSGATLADGTATGTIQNDDAAPAVTAPPTGNPAAADTRAPVVQVKAAKAKLAKALAKGLAVSVTSDEAGKAVVVMTAGGKTVGTARVTFAAPGTKRVVVRFSKKAKASLAKLRKLRLKIKATATDAAGNAGSRSLTLNLAR